jgi:DNA-binding MarR family transcriptional regulator
MADINSLAPRGTASVGSGPGDPATALCDEHRLVTLVELLFFAYRDFTAEADAVLEEFGFGRAHHRVLHFVHRNPGLRVADLLDILRITKQSLARVLKQLVGEGYIAQQAGTADRRERLLYVTAKGAALAERLAALQRARVARALAASGGPDAADGQSPRWVERFLFGMIADDDRADVARLIGAAARK